MSYFLGLDCSTQSLTAILIDFDLKRVIYRNCINFDEDLPHYNTRNGVITLENEKIVHSYPLMWVEALELVFKKLKQSKNLIGKIKAISGSAQQHGTVYLNNKFERSLKDLDANNTLAEQLKKTFSRETSPIWMDSSTAQQCEEIREQLGGRESSIRILGSNIIERFSSPQIRKFYEENKKGYQETNKIHLVSSFMASILLGKNAPIDHGDGAGMNLMNIKTKEWDNLAIKATAPNLINKLPPLVNSYDIIGTISPYFVKKYGFSSETLLVAWSGDNPNSLIGVGLIEKGKVAISLGTSDTYFGYLKNLYLDLKGEGHVFCAPTGDYMSLICFKNGSLARDQIREKFNLTWNEFSNILKKTPPGNYGKIMLPYFFPETVPLVLDSKVYRFGFNDQDLNGNVRAIIEAQFLSMRLHSKWIREIPKEIYATGGASANKEILQIAANIFSTPILRFEFTESAALGAALRSVKSYYNYNKIQLSWKDIVESLIKNQDYSLINPQKKYTLLYHDMLEIYKKYEEFILKNGEYPEELHKRFIDKYFSS